LWPPFLARRSEGSISHLGNPMYALLIADSPDETAMLSLVLQRAGLACTSTSSLERAMQNWSGRPADLVVVALPAPEYRAQVRRVRAESEVPLILLVDPISEALHYDLLETGADLVLMRPYSSRLLAAQIRALLRRAGGVPIFSLPTLSIAGLSLDPATRTVETAGQPARRLTHLEFRLLYTLMMHRGQVLPTETIVERVWGHSGEGDRELVRGLVSRLRGKVEAEPSAPRYIVTVPGVGYAFSAEEH
jgi:DNA-binding response OmpR family regulator